MIDLLRLSVYSDKSDFKFEDFELELNKLNVMVGANGAGKTFLMKFAWFTSYALQMYKAALLFGGDKAEDEFAKNFNKLFKWTFDRSEEISGIAEVVDKKRTVSFQVHFKAGELDFFNMDVGDKDKFKATDITNVQYNSKTARLFESLHQYLRLKKKFKIESLAQDGAMDEICEFYKIYDVIWFENVIRKMKRLSEEGINEVFPGIDIASHLAYIFAGALADDSVEDRFQLNAIKIDEEGMPIFVMQDGNEMPVLRLSSGQQSMLMMTLFM